MTQTSSENRATPMQIAGLVLMLVVLLNVAFYFLSDLYFADRVKRFGANELQHMPGVRTAFGVFSGVVGVAAILAAFAPKQVGHGLAAALGLLSLYAATASFGAGMQGALGVGLAVLGVAFPLLAWFSYRGSRPAWAFLIALTSVMALMLLFGAPKVRNIVGVGLWTAMILPGLFSVATASLLVLRSRYSDPVPTKI